MKWNDFESPKEDAKNYYYTTSLCEGDDWCSWELIIYEGKNSAPGEGTLISKVPAKKKHSKGGREGGR
jgi:hypothetical protein